MGPLSGVSTGRLSGSGVLWDCVPRVCGGGGGCAGGGVPPGAVLALSWCGCGEVSLGGILINRGGEIGDGEGGEGRGRAEPHASTSWLRVGLYKICIHFEAFLHESVMLLPQHLYCPRYYNTIA